MADNRTIELVLKAQLDARDAISSAGQAGQQIAAAFSQAFNNLGSQLGQTFYNAIVQTLQQRIGSGGIPGGQMAQAPSGAGMMQSSGGIWTPPGAATPAQQGSMAVQSPAVSYFSTPGGSSTLFNNSMPPPGMPGFSGGRPNNGDGGMGIMERVIGNLTSNGLIDPQSDLSGRGMSTDARLGRARAFKSLKGTDPSASADTYLGKDFYQKGGDWEDIGKRLKETANKNMDQVLNLEQKIKGNEDRIYGRTKTGESERNGKSEADYLAELLEETKHLRTDLNKTVNDQDAIKKDSADYRSLDPEHDSKRSMRSMIGTGIAVGSQLADFGMNLPIEYARSKAGSAAYGQAGMRDVLNGDMDKQIAAVLYGQDNLSSDSTLGGIGSLIGRTGKNILQGVGGTALSAFGPAGGAIGAGMASDAVLGTVHDFMNFDSIRNDKRNQILDATVSENQPFLQSYGTASSKSIGAFRRGQAMGDSGLSDILLSGDKRTQIMDPSTGKPMYNNENVGGWGALSALHNMTGSTNWSETKANASEFWQQMTTGQKTTNAASINRQGLRSYGVNEANLSGDQFDQFMGGMVGGMGGSFQGTSASATSAFKSLQNSEVMKTALKMKGDGFSNIEDVASGAFAGGSYSGSASGDRERSLKQMEEMYTRAVAAGMDKSKMPQIMGQLAQSMASSGIGSSEGLMNQFDRNLSVTQQVFGKGPIEAGQFNTVNDYMNRLSGQATSTEGLGMLAGLQSVDDFSDKYSKEIKGGLSDNERLVLQRMKTMSGPDLKEFLGDKVKGVSDEKLDEMSKFIPNSRAGNVLKAVGQGLGDEVGTTISLLSQGVDSLGQYNSLKKASNADMFGTAEAIMPLGTDKTPDPAGKKEAKTQEQADLAKLNAGLGAMSTITDSLVKNMGNLNTQLQDLVSKKLNYILYTDQ